MTPESVESIILEENPTASAWWIENGPDKAFVCFDTENGKTVAFDVTDANFGGEVQR